MPDDKPDKPAKVAKSDKPIPDPKALAELFGGGGPKKDVNPPTLVDAP